MTRCHDHQCHARARCERWIKRHERAAGLRQASTLKPAWITHSDPCRHFHWHQPLHLDDLPLRGPAGWLIVAWLAGQRPLHVPIRAFNIWSALHD